MQLVSSPASPTNSVITTATTTTNVTTSGDPDELHLSNHCRAMRKALAYIRRVHWSTILPLQQQLHEEQEEEEKLQQKQQHVGNSACTTKEIICSWKKNARDAARNVTALRKQALEQWVITPSLASSPPSIPNIESLRDNPSTTATMTPNCFRRSYQQANVPCKIQHLNDCYFGTLQNQWVTVEKDYHSTAYQDKLQERRRICNEWFLNALGGETIVPVRILDLPENNCDDDFGSSDLDAQGRAIECATKEMTLRQWIQLLFLSDENADSEDAVATSQSPRRSSLLSRYYLKDWHLQAVWAQRRKEEYSTSNFNDNSSFLYNVPPHFGMDLLNRFLTLAFNDEENNRPSSDYFFCYWGPAGSRSTRHSDVLNSYSWSYNVCGRKTWTFYPPSTYPSDCLDPNSCDDSENNFGQQQLLSTPTPSSSSSSSSCVCFPLTIEQGPGECIFVPSLWQHSVVNDEESLSINHNWITTANIDLVWDCLQQEIEAIDKELSLWNHPNVLGINGREQLEPHYSAPSEPWEARECMLRGCTGMNVTAFFFMTLLGIYDSLEQWTAITIASTSAASHTVAILAFLRLKATKHRTQRLLI